MEILIWLQDWYRNNCDGYWEHMFGIKIYTLDNPGWSVKIDLEDTELVDKPFNKIQYDNGDDDWLLCMKKDEKFSAGGDPDKLIEILTIFKNWVER